MGRIVDLSHGLDPQTPVYPGDPPVGITVVSSTEQQTGGPRAMNVGRIDLGLHAGTHLDAPFHFFGEGQTLEQVPLEHCLGPALLINLPHHGAGDQITPEDLAGYRDALRETGKVVLNTGWYRRWGEPDYFSAHPVLTGEAAQFLVECGVHLVGVDFPSVDLPPHDAHIVLLGRGVLIVENLTHLDAIGAERFLLSALPLKITGREGSPVRAVALEIESCLS
jgi:kynurenine formamidase